MVAGTRQRILIISHDIIGSRMAGTGIRYWELARVLARWHEVTLIAPQPIDTAPPGVISGSYTWGDQASLETWLNTDIVIANGFLLLEHNHLADIAQPLALDLYDPVLLENLELWRGRDEQERLEQNRKDYALLQRQLRAGDFLMCATERQRDLLIGALMATGRITHAVTDVDPTLRRLIDVVPFGLSDEPPRYERALLRGIVPGIGADDLILLWTGGLWDWMDPHTLIEAMPAVIARHPSVRLVFLAGQHPGAVQPMQTPGIARQRAADLGLLDTHIFFYDRWIPYDERANVLHEADIAVSLHHNHLETAYAAVRSRFLDHLWAGLPSIVADGDAAADLVRSHGLGLVIPPGDQPATAQALEALLSDVALRTTSARHASELAHAYTWDAVARPLSAFCDAPWHSQGSAQPADESTTIEAAIQPTPHIYQGVNATMRHEQEVLLKQLEQSWQFGTLPTNAGGADRLLHQAVLRVIGPLIAQQREFNAALVKLLYTLQEQGDLDTTLNAVMAQVTANGREVSALRSDVRALNADTNTRIDTVSDFTGDMSARLDVLEHDLHGRLDTVSQFGGDLNDRLTRLAYAAQLLDQAVVAGDELDRVLAEEIAALARHSQNHAASATAHDDIDEEATT